MNKPTIIAYLKDRCGWSDGVRAVLSKYDLPYEERNIQSDPRNYMEMTQRSGQERSPCVVVNGAMLADVSGDEVEQFLIGEKLIVISDKAASAPTNAACETHPARLDLA